MQTGAASQRRQRELVAANLLLVVLLAVHSLDHVLRQSDPVPAEAAVAGLAGLGTAVVCLVLAIAGSRWAPTATALVGLATPIGFVAIHVLPEWSVFSQPYADIDVDALSWIGMLVPAIAAAGVGAIGLRAARSQQFSAAS